MFELMQSVLLIFIEMGKCGIKDGLMRYSLYCFLVVRVFMYIFFWNIF